MGSRRMGWVIGWGGDAHLQWGVGVGQGGGRGGQADGKSGGRTGPRILQPSIPPPRRQSSHLHHMILILGKLRLNQSQDIVDPWDLKQNPRPVHN